MRYHRLRLQERERERERDVCWLVINVQPRNHNSSDILVDVLEQRPRKPWEHIEVPTVGSITGNMFTRTRCVVHEPR